MVTNYLTLLEQKHDSALDDDSRQYMTFVLEGASRMRALLRDLLEYAEVSVVRRSPMLMDFTAVLKDCVQDLRPDIDQKNVEVIVDPLPQIWGDPIQMSQLFSNLLGNAVKYCTSDHPTIRISAEPSPEGWVFSVQDNGIGLEMKYANKIFEPFRRLHSRDQFAGTGIGLAICRKIVEGHRGRIWVQSEPGIGSTFRFTLPDMLTEPALTAMH